ncbi:glycosyltransferase family 39 protein [soil metagenome]
MGVGSSDGALRAECSARAETETRGGFASFAPWRRDLAPAAALTVLVLLARLVYLWKFCPYDLTEDEAFYWDWSRHLAWSYNTKGPGIAWAIRAAVEAFGTSMPGVRMVAALSGAATMLACAALGAWAVRALGAGSAGKDRVRASDGAAAENTAPRRGALIAAALAALMPGYQVIGLLATIDGPYVACWAAACVLGAGALIERRRAAWPLLGAALALGFIFKYTTVLLALGLVGFALHRRAVRRRAANTPGKSARAAWIAACVFIALLGVAPVLIWNAQHEWATLRHLLAHVGIALPTNAPGADSAAAARVAAATSAAETHSTWTIRHFAEFAGAQIGLVGPAIAILMVAGCAASFPRRRTDSQTAAAEHDVSTGREARLLLLWCSLPLLIFYLALAVVQEAEGNWAIAAYAPLTALAAAWIVRRERRAQTRAWAHAAWHGALIVGVVSGLGMLRLDLVKNALEPILPALARAIPLGRISGAQEMAAAVDSQRAMFRTQPGAEPFIMVEHYGRASQLAFYCAGRPHVVCASSFVGGRRVQQDFWPEERPDWPGLRGRPAVVVDSFDRKEIWESAFGSVMRMGELPGAYGRGTRFAFGCTSFKGMAARENVGY